MNIRRSHIDHRQSTSDVVYFNASIKNNKNVSIQAFFQQARSQNIIEKCNDYYLAVVRLEVPHSTVAMFNFAARDYFVTINNGVTDFTTQLLYVSDGNPTSNLDSAFQGIYTFQQFLDSLNTALRTSHIAAGIAGNAPMMVYEEDGRFSLNVDTNYTIGVDEIFFNDALFRLFQGIQSEFISFTATSNKDYRMIYGPLFNNILTYPTNPIFGYIAGDYYKMSQETQSQFTWVNISSIVVTTNTIPCKKEYIGLSSDNNSTESQTITDFIPVQQNFNKYDRTPWVYEPQDGYRLVDLESDSPLRTIQFKVELVNDESFIFPVSLAPGENILLKMMFMKKSLVNNEYTQIYNPSDNIVSYGESENSAKVIGSRTSFNLTNNRELTRKPF